MLTATKVVDTMKAVNETREDLNENRCNFVINVFGDETIFTIHDFDDFIIHQVHFNDFLLSSARN